MQSFKKAGSNLLYTFLFGFFGGIAGMMLQKERLLFQTGFLDSYTLSPVKYMDIDTGALLEVVLTKRLGIAFVLVILSTTYLGTFVAYLYQLKSGIILGLLTAGAVIRYGVKGLFLALGGIFPQQLLLIPAFLVLSLRCCEVCRLLYSVEEGAGFHAEKKKRLLQKGVQIACCLAVVITGCLLETYVNPKILKFVLQIF